MEEKKKNSLDGKIGRRKVTAEIKQFIINKFAIGAVPSDIAKDIEKEFGVKLAWSTLGGYKRRYVREIIEQREYFNNHVWEIEPFAQKVNRIKARGDLIRDLFKNLWEYELNVKHNTIVYDENNRPIVNKTKGRHGMINKLLDSIAAELEATKIEVDPGNKTERMVNNLLSEAKDIIEVTKRELKQLPTSKEAIKAEILTDKGNGKN